MNESQAYEYRKTLHTRARGEVVVCGGGTAGTIAAIAAAREGRKTILVEQFGGLGGTASLGLVTPTMSTHVVVDGVRRDPKNSYIAAELDARAEAAGAMTRKGYGLYYDPLLLKGILEEMVTEAGVEVYLYTKLIDTVMDGSTIRALVVADKEGLHLMEGDVFVDATGDGDLSVLAGAAFTAGNPKSGKNQPISLRYTVSGVDTRAFAASVTDGSITYSERMGAYADCVKQDGARQVEQILKRAKDAGDLIAEDLAYWQVFTLPNRPDTLACNCPEFFDFVNGTRSYDLTRAQLVGKQAILRHLAFYQKYFKGFERAYISEIAPMVGVRESREIETDCILTLPQAMAYAKFADCVAQTNYSIDVHGFGDDFSNGRVGNGQAEQPWFEVPFGSLVVRRVENLLVAGRSIGVDFFVEAAIRIIPTCRATGEAAGLAAALSLEHGIPLHALDGKTVHDAMIARGAEFV